MSERGREEAFAAYRDYLCTLQAIQVSPRLRAKLSHSDLVQKTLVDALREEGTLMAMEEPARRARLKVMLLHNLHDEVDHYRAQCRDVWREQPMAEADRSSASISQWLPADGPAPPELAEQAERRELLLAALAQLPKEQSEAIILQHLHGWTLAEIAEHQGRTVGAVAGHVRRGMEQMPDHLLDPR